jgi:ribosomal protein S18 acetylase RimI-like enzyme
MTVVADIRRAFLEGGSKLVVTRGLKKLVRPAVRVGTLVFMEADLTEALPPQRPAPGIVAREATIDDVHLFEDQESFLKRFREGHRCFAGIEERSGRLANYRWVNSTAAFVPELDRHLILKTGEVYIYDLNTLPDFRRRGIDAYTRHYTYSYLRDEGYTRVLAYIHGDNQPSLKASRYLLKEIGRVRYIRFPGRMPIIIGGRGAKLPELRR